MKKILRVGKHENGVMVDVFNAAGPVAVVWDYTSIL